MSKNRPYVLDSVTNEILFLFSSAANSSNGNMGWVVNISCDLETNNSKSFFSASNSVLKNTIFSLSTLSFFARTSSNIESYLPIVLYLLNTFPFFNSLLTFGE